MESRWRLEKAIQQTEAERSNSRSVSGPKTKGGEEIESGRYKDQVGSGSGRNIMLTKHTGQGCMHL